ncbi:MAG: hypothetical protein IPN53_05645 [Comamonadaceae bacterium]|nr:hypothetical protein [Comamonadaceae bacterium]
MVTLIGTSRNLTNSARNSITGVDHAQTQTSVYPREVLLEALACQASAVILVHNHPSGSAAPSRADELLTSTLKQALALVDVRVLDHFIVTRSSVFSFAEAGLL